MKNLIFIAVCLMAAMFLTGFKPRKPDADILFYNARVYTLNEPLEVVSAFTVTEGRITGTGTVESLKGQFNVLKEVDLGGKFVYPGFIDAHSHFMGLGEVQFVVDLTGAKSWNEVIQRCRAFYEKNKKLGYIKGRGWDQNLWAGKKFPVNDELNKLFGNIPVLLKRIDGHAAIVNNVVLQKAGYTTKTRIEGGALIQQDNHLTGVLLDNAVDAVENNPNIFPERQSEQWQTELDTAERICFSKGLTSVCDAGITAKQAAFLQQATYRIRIYAMLNVSNENIDRYMNQPVKTPNLNISSFKMYADGSLGSRGACLLKPYADQPGNYGFLVTPVSQMEEYVQRIANSTFQLNTHCIGDSANRTVIGLYAQYLQPGNDRRWRIEHAQVVAEEDCMKLEEFRIIPSVQPVHATSDMGWAEERLGKERMPFAYNYKRLFETNRYIALGTDFPVESPDPLFTFYAAVARKDKSGKPANGFQPGQALSREEALKGMTIWAAKAAFEEQEKGSLEAGKFADFVVLDVDLMSDDLEAIREGKVLATYVNGEAVYECR